MTANSQCTHHQLQISPGGRYTNHRIIILCMYVYIIEYRLEGISPDTKYYSNIVVYMFIPLYYYPGSVCVYVFHVINSVSLFWGCNICFAVIFFFPFYLIFQPKYMENGLSMNVYTNIRKIFFSFVKFFRYIFYNILAIN